MSDHEINITDIDLYVEDVDWVRVHRPTNDGNIVRVELLRRGRSMGDVRLNIRLNPKFATGLIVGRMTYSTFRHTDMEDAANDDAQSTV